VIVPYLGRVAARLRRRDFTVLISIYQCVQSIAT